MYIHTQKNSIKNNIVDQVKSKKILYKIVSSI